MEEKRKQRTK